MPLQGEQELAQGSPTAALLGVGALESGGPCGALIPDLAGAGGALQRVRGSRLDGPLHRALRLLVLQDGPVKHIVPLVPCRQHIKHMPHEPVSWTERFQQLAAWSASRVVEALYSLANNQIPLSRQIQSSPA